MEEKKRVGATKRRREEDGILRRLREHLLYSELRSLLPPQSSQAIVDSCKVEGLDEVRCEEATEIEMERDEIPSDIDQSSSSEEEINRRSGGACFISTGTDDSHDELKEEHEEDGVSGSLFTLELEIEENMPFVPSIEIRKMAENTIFVSTVASKEVALASKLFQILEEEKLDIVFENQHRTEDTVHYNIQVRVEPGYDLEALGKKLGKWAGGKNHT